MGLPSKPLAATIDIAAAAAAVVKYVAEKRTSNADPDRLYDEMNKLVKGQHLAIRAITEEIAAGLANEKRTKPIASLFLVGPPGVGKSQTAESLSMVMYGELPLVIECSQLKDAETAKNMLFGLPPSYKNAESGGTLTKRLAQKKNGTVVVMDEIEKADKSIQTLLLSALNEGMVTDYFSQSRVSCKNAIFLFTSNARENEIVAAATGLTELEDIHTATKDVIATSGSFDNAFLDRVGLFVAYLPLKPDALIEFAVAAIHRECNGVNLEIAALDQDAVVRLVGDVILNEGNRAGPRQVQSALKRGLGMKLRGVSRSGSTHVAIVHSDKGITAQPAPAPTPGV